MTLETQSLNLNARQILIKRLSTVQSLDYTGPIGELVLDTTLKLLRIQDGVTPGGILITSANYLASQVANLQSQINSILSNVDPNAIDSITEVLANVQALLGNNVEYALVNNGFFANLSNTGDLILDGDLLPKDHLSQSLGSSTKAWANLYVGSNTIFLGNTPISLTNNGLQIGTTGNLLPIFANIKFPDGSIQRSAVDQTMVANIFTVLSPNVAANLVAIDSSISNATSYFRSIVAEEVEDIRANLAALSKTWENPHTNNTWYSNEYHSGARVVNVERGTGIAVPMETNDYATLLTEYDASDDSINIITISRTAYPDFAVVVEGSEIGTVINANVFIGGNYVDVTAMAVQGNVYRISLNNSIPAYPANEALVITYDTTNAGIPVAWFNANTSPSGSENFRGAVIDYHAFSQDSGTIIGTIRIANDEGQNYVSHSETGSGISSLGTNILWGRFGGKEDKLYYYRTDGASMPIAIHWVAKMFYGADSL